MVIRFAVLRTGTGTLLDTQRRRKPQIRENCVGLDLELHCRSRYLQDISNTAETGEPTDRSRSRGNTEETEPTDISRSRGNSITAETEPIVVVVVVVVVVVANGDLHELFTL